MNPRKFPGKTGWGVTEYLGNCRNKNNFLGIVGIIKGISGLRELRAGIPWIWVSGIPEFPGFGFLECWNSPDLSFWNSGIPASARGIPRGLFTARPGA